MSEKDIAIRCVQFRKTYTLYGSIAEMALDRLSLSFAARWVARKESPKFEALRGIDLQVAKGERLGIVGRNGAGKTTLLKLVTQNFLPTSGDIEVNGSVQTLMATGLGFHPEFTGRENLVSALEYNGLARAELSAAIADCIEFSELGEFIDQSVSSYSLGMKMRLQFAAATAIRPDILIVDEVLGAGDAYFAAKSAARVRSLTKTGCTLLLVSHSMQQILQYCERAMWIEAGQIVMRGEPLAVVRAYEEFSRRLEIESIGAAPTDQKSEARRSSLLDSIIDRAQSATLNAMEVDMAKVSRWPGKDGVRVKSVRVVANSASVPALVYSGDPFGIELLVERTSHDVENFTPVVLFYGEDGMIQARNWGRPLAFSGEASIAKAKLSFDKLLLGAGRYVVSIGLYQKLDEADLSKSVSFEILSRCLVLEVLPSTLGDESKFTHPGEWSLGQVEAI